MLELLIEHYDLSDTISLTLMAFLLLTFALSGSIRIRWRRQRYY